MKSKDVIKRLEAEGWKLARTKGSHQHYKLAGRGLVTVPHPSQDIATGTLRSIYRQAGWEWK